MRALQTTMFLGLLAVAAPLLVHAQAPDPATFSLSAGDVTEAIVSTSGPARLKVLLSPEKSAELADFTARNLNRQGRIVVAGKLRAEPFIRERMSGPTLEIYVTSNEDALAAIRALLTAKVNFDQLAKWRDSSGQTHYAERRPGPTPALAAPTGQITEARSWNLLKQLEGSWEVVKAAVDGKESGDRSLLEGQWKFQGNELVISSPQEGTVRFVLKLDTGTKPMALYLMARDPADAGSGWMIFAREGNTLKIAFHDNLDGRPGGFEPRDPPTEPGLVVVTLSPKK